MKKILIIFLVFSTASFCFAAGQRQSIEIGAGYHRRSGRLPENQTVLGIEVEAVIPSFAMSLSGVTFLTENVGIGAYVNFLFPQEFRTTAMGLTVTADRSDFDFIFGMGFLAGPTFMLFRSGPFSIPLAVGFHCHMLWANTTFLDTRLITIGLGSNITGEFHFNERIYAFARFQASVDLYSWATSQINTIFGSMRSSISGGIFTWAVNPSIGIGFKW